MPCRYVHHCLKSPQSSGVRAASHAVWLCPPLSHLATIYFSLECPMNLEMNWALLLCSSHIRNWDLGLSAARERRGRSGKGYPLGLGWQGHQQTQGPRGLGAWVLFSQSPVLLGRAVLTLGLVHDFPRSKEIIVVAGSVLRYFDFLSSCLKGPEGM